MIELQDISEANWIDQKIKSGPESYKGEVHKVWHVIPQGFAAYCKLFSPIYLDMSRAQDLRTWNDIRNEPEEIKLLEARETSPKLNFQGLRVYLKELASSQGIPFTPQISDDDIWKVSWPIRYVHSAGEGEISPEEAIQLSKMLLNMSKSKEYLLTYEDGHDWNNPHKRVFSAHLSEPLITLQMLDMFPGTSSFWWGVEKDWCLAMNFDLTFSFFGGSTEMVQALLNDEILECIQIGIDERYY